MATMRHFTDEQKAELLSNPYTYRITECTVIFTLAFKQLVMDNIDLPGMSARNVFRLAGYSDSLFSDFGRRYIVNCIRREAASEKGLTEPTPLKRIVKPRKKHSETEFKELQERVALLEQQINFLKKSQLLKKQDRSMRPNNSS